MKKVKLIFLIIILNISCWIRDIYHKISMLSKNKLQEYFQKRNEKLPQYTTTQFTPQPNLTWKSIVRIFNPDMTFEGDADISKTATESSAALKAIQWLEANNNKYQKSKTHVNNLTNKKSPFSSKSEVSIRSKEENSNVQTEIIKNDKQIVIIIDVENIPKLVEEIMPFLDIYSNLHVYAFSGEHASQTKSLEGIEHPRLNKIISSSTRKDGTDTCIQLHVGMFLYDETFDVYVVCTRDHYGGALIEFITMKGMLWPSKEGYLATSLNHIDKIIQS